MSHRKGPYDGKEGIAAGAMRVNIPENITTSFPEVPCPTSKVNAPIVLPLVLSLEGIIYKPENLAGVLACIVVHAVSVVPDGVTEFAGSVLV